MPKTKHGPQIGKAEKQKLNRFGCAFDSRKGVFLIEWPSKWLRQAETSTIVVRLFTQILKAGPVFCVAFEISRVRALPEYRYSLLDLTKHENKKYLSALAQTGQMRTYLLAGTSRIERPIRLLPYQCLRIAELITEACDQLRRFEPSRYDFEGAVRDFEQSIRIPDVFERVISEVELPKFLKAVRESAANATIDNRALAKRIVAEFVEVLSAHSSNIRTVLHEWFPVIRKALQLSNDMFRLYATDSDGFVEILGDAIASQISTEDLNKLSSWPKNAAPVFNWLAQLGSLRPPERAFVLPQMPRELAEALQRLASGQGVSLNAVKNLLPLFGIPVGGQPGRQPKDYSREYNLKARLSWSQVARISLQENAELREEFGDRDFDSLDLRQQEALQNRIRAGVKSYAEREGKPFPIKNERLPSPDAEGE